MTSFGLQPSAISILARKCRKLWKVSRGVPSGLTIFAAISTGFHACRYMSGSSCTLPRELGNTSGPGGLRFLLFELGLFPPPPGSQSREGSQIGSPLLFACRSNPINPEGDPAHSIGAA